MRRRLQYVCVSWLARLSDNRDGLWRILAPSDAPDARLSSFVNGSDLLSTNLTYSENLLELMIFLTVALAAANIMAAGGYGVAVIDTFNWAASGQDVSVAVGIDLAVHRSISDQSARISAAESCHRFSGRHS